MEQRHDTDMAVTRSCSVHVSCQTDTQEMNCLTTLVGFGAIFKRGELQKGGGWVGWVGGSKGNFDASFKAPTRTRKM